MSRGLTDENNIFLLEGPNQLKDINLENGAKDGAHANLQADHEASRANACMFNSR